MLSLVALGFFSLHVLQKSIRETILSPPAPRSLLAFRAAMRTDEFHQVLLRIAVQSCPARAAHTNNLTNAPLHWEFPPGSTSAQLDAALTHRDVPAKHTFIASNFKEFGASEHAASWGTCVTPRRPRL